MLLSKFESFFLVVLVSNFYAHVVQADAAGAEDNFCAGVQKWIAGTELRVSNRVHENYQAFVESKALIAPLETQQFYSNRLAGPESIPSVVSCKMKTRGSISHTYSPGQPLSDWGNSDAACDLVTRKMLRSATQAVPEQERLLSAHNIVIDAEILTFMGPMWLNPWPFQSAYSDNSGTVHLRSKALYVPWSRLIPAPAAFKGVYYCHLASPAYLEAILRGEAEVPTLAENE